MRDRWTDQLSDYLDDELPAADRAALETHLTGCAECSSVLADLRAVVARAGVLEPLSPDQDLWPGIAAKIGASPAATTRVLPLARRGEKRWSLSLSQLAAAAVLLMTLSGGTVWLLQSPANGPAGIAVTPPASPTAIPAGATATQSYAAAVADLERVLADGRNQLDTATVRVIQQNLMAIDNAIAQAQQALSADPANMYLNTHLAETMRRKLDLLRQAATLVHAS